MTAEHAAAKHIELMRKLEKDYDRIEDPVDRAKMASSLMKGSETYLRAAGHFVQGGKDGAEGSIIINIDMGDDKAVKVEKNGEEAKVVKIDESNN